MKAVGQARLELSGVSTPDHLWPPTDLPPHPRKRNPAYEASSVVFSVAFFVAFYVATSADMVLVVSEIPWKPPRGVGGGGGVQPHPG